MNNLFTRYFSSSALLAVGDAHPTRAPVWVFVLLGTVIAVAAVVLYLTTTIGQARYGGTPYIYLNPARHSALSTDRSADSRIFEGKDMTDENLISDFVEKMKSGAGTNLVSVILYGSAADGEFHPEYSDLNLLCLMTDVSLPELTKIAGVMSWWYGKRHHPPLVITPRELISSADVFSIEFSDMKQRYRVLYGEDLLRNLEVPMAHHREQLEYELREKLFLLRQHLLLAGRDEKQLWEVMLHSLSSFTTLFRHVLVEMGEQGRKHSREAVAELSKKLTFDDSAFLQLLDVRAKKGARGSLRANDLAARYLDAITTVATAVDQMQSSKA